MRPQKYSSKARRGSTVLACSIGLKRDVLLAAAGALLLFGAGAVYAQDAKLGDPTANSVGKQADAPEKNDQTKKPASPQPNLTTEVQEEPVDFSERYAGYLESGFDPVLAGEAEYKSACATCHGLGGKGDGPMAQSLKVKPPNLQTINKRAGGIFPLSLVYDVIEGRERVRAHGDTMPVWGSAFRAELGRLSQPIEPWLEEAAIAARIQSLVFYLESIQDYGDEENDTPSSTIKPEKKVPDTK